jgi:hypothetical protein
MSERDPRDILRLKRCPKCGYDLAGLPRNHACPECGARYDESTFIIDVGGKKSKAQRCVEAAYFATVTGLALLYACFSGTRASWRVPWGMLAFILAVLATRAFLSLFLRMRGGIDRAGFLRLRFDATGVSKVGEQRLADIAYSSISDVAVAKRPWERRYRLKIITPAIAGLRVAWINGTLRLSREEAEVLREELRTRLQDAKSIAIPKARDRASD